MKKKITLIELGKEYLYMKPHIDHALGSCLEAQNWILGPEVKELENKIAEYIGIKHAVGVASGTDALVLSLRALAIKLKGQEYFSRTDKIITTPFTFTATGDAILRAGATPLFVDIDPKTYNIDCVKLDEYLNSHGPSEIAGIIPVHLYGQACNMDKIMECARKYNLFVIEDTAQAFGGMWKGKKLGSFGMAGAFSFFPSKNLGGFGDGGMVVTNDPETAELVRMLLKHGGKDKYNVDHLGYNSRLDTIQAAVLLVKLKYLDEFNQLRRKSAGIYQKSLDGINAISLPKSLPEAHHVYHQYTIRISGDKRTVVQRKLEENSIASAVYYPVPLHRMKVFQNQSEVSGTLREAENSATQVLSLPIGPLLKEEEISFICACIKGVVV